MLVGVIRKFTVVLAFVLVACGDDDGPEPDWAAHEAAQLACIQFEGAIGFASQWSTGLEMLDEEALPHLEEAARLNPEYLGLQALGSAVRDAVFEQAPFDLAEYYALLEVECQEIQYGDHVPALEGS